MSIETKSKAPASFRIPFAVLFDANAVEIKDSTKVNFMSNIHGKRIDNQPISDAHLYDYCVCLWSFVEFLRTHPTLQTTMPLEFLVRGTVCNCYWWEVMTATNQYAEQIASKVIPSKSESKVKLEAFRSCKAALGLLHKWKTEGWTQWTDRGPATAFGVMLNKIQESNDALHKALWKRALSIGAQVIENNMASAHSAAQMYATIYELSDRKDTLALATGLQVESRHLHHVAEYGMAIALAQAYERIQSDITHPDLNIWLKSNDTTWHAQIPMALDATTALANVGTTKAYEKGTPVVIPVLFELKKKT